MAPRPALLLALALALSCEHRDIQPPRAPEPPVPIAAPAPECAPIPLDDPPPASSPALRQPGPLVDLAVLVPAAVPKRAPHAPRKRLDLGRLARKMRPPHPGALVDVSRLWLPPEVPRADLPDALRTLWDRDRATRDELRLAQVQRARAERKEHECKAVACGELACIAKRIRELDDQVQAARDRRVGERRELCASLRKHIDNLGEKAPAGAVLALGNTLETIAREETDGGPAELAAALKEPIALYERAASIAGAASDIGWFARYHLGAALEDTGELAKAKAVFAALALASPMGSRAAQASYHEAELENDPARAAEAYQRAAAGSGKDTAIRTVSLYKGARSALEAERPADALAAGAVLCSESVVTDPDQGADLLAEGAQVTAEALGRLLVARPAPALPSVPAAAFAPIAARVAEDALYRFDVAQAVQAWEALVAHAPGAPEARDATAALAAAHARASTGGDKKRELEARLWALVHDCARTRPVDDTTVELTVNVDAAAAGPARITVRAQPSSPALTACLMARGAAFFVDAPADLRATLALTIGF